MQRYGVITVIFDTFYLLLEGCNITSIVMAVTFCLTNIEKKFRTNKHKQILHLLV